MAVYADCSDCSGQVIVGMFDTITVPKLDADGNPIAGQTVRIKLPWHKASVPESVLRPTGQFNGNADRERQLAVAEDQKRAAQEKQK